MAYFVLKNLQSVNTAIGLLSTVQGAYTAVDILKGALSGVTEPEDLDANLRNPDLQQFNSFEGPAAADREIFKAMKTAANAESQQQDSLLELVSMVLVRLGFAKGSKVLSLLLAACGVDPTLSMVVLKLCLLLARTEEGKKIVGAALPKIRDQFATSAYRTQLNESLQSLAKSLGDKGAEAMAMICSSMNWENGVSRDGPDKKP